MKAALVTLLFFPLIPVVNVKNIDNSIVKIQSVLLVLANKLIANSNH